MPGETLRQRDTKAGSWQWSCLRRGCGWVQLASVSLAHAGPRQANVDIPQISKTFSTQPGSQQETTNGLLDEALWRELPGKAATGHRPL